MGFNDASIEQAKLKQCMRKNSNKVAMLVDSTKFGKSFMCHDFWFDDVDYLICEKLPPKEFLEVINKSKCKLITPETESL
jgi:DeoR/GlpR family transcriptional regulator of sugar metabolism